MHTDRHFNPTTTKLHPIIWIAGILVMLGASACSSPEPATAAEPATSQVATEADTPSFTEEELQAASSQDTTDGSRVILDTLPVVPGNAEQLVDLAVADSFPASWLLDNVDDLNSVRFSGNGTGGFETFRINGAPNTTLAAMETRLQAEGWLTRSTSDDSLLASKGDAAAELTTIDMLADGPDLDISFSAPTGMLNLDWTHDWWTGPLNDAGIDGTPHGVNVRWQKMRRCDDCVFTRLSVVVDGLSANELAGRLAATGNGWAITEDPGWVVVTSPAGQDVHISSDLGELSATIEAETTTDFVQTTEEADEQTFGDYVCWLLAGEITDLDGATTWEEFAAQVGEAIAADPALVDLIDNDPNAFTALVESSATEACAGLAESFADGSGRQLVQQGYDSTVIED